MPRFRLPGRTRLKSSYDKPALDHVVGFDAVRVRLSAQDGAEQREADNAGGADPVLVREETRSGFGAAVISQLDGAAPPILSLHSFST